MDDEGLSALAFMLDDTEGNVPGSGRVAAKFLMENGALRYDRSANDYSLSPLCKAMASCDLEVFELVWEHTIQGICDTENDKEMEIFGRIVNLAINAILEEPELIYVCKRAAVDNGFDISTVAAKITSLMTLDQRVLPEILDKQPAVESLHALQNYIDWPNQSLQSLILAGQRGNGNDGTWRRYNVPSYFICGFAA